MKTQEIADLVGGELVGDGNVEIRGVAALPAASVGEIAFKTEPGEIVTKASCLIAPSDFKGKFPCTVIRVSDPKLAFSQVAEVLHPPRTRRAETHPSAVVAETASIGADVFIGPFVCIGENTSIGDGTQLGPGTVVGDDVTVGTGCVFGPNVFVDDRCSIGANVKLHAGVVIGSDGFGYVRGPNRLVKFPQIGTVVIEDNVEIGANTCVDRGALGETRIGEGTKIDNLVQIAHNVKIGKRVIIAAQTGISGSTVIEDDCVIGGQVGMGDHAVVKSRAIIGSQAGVLPGKIVREGVWWGTPVQPLAEFKRQHAHLKGLERLKNDVKELKELRKK